MTCPTIVPSSAGRLTQVVRDTLEHAAARLHHSLEMNTYNRSVRADSGRSLRRALRRSAGGFVAFLVSFGVIVAGRATGSSTLEMIGAIGGLIAFGWGFVWTAIVGIVSAKALQERLRETPSNADDIDRN